MSRHSGKLIECEKCGGKGKVVTNERPELKTECPECKGIGAIVLS